MSRIVLVCTFLLLPLAPAFGQSSDVCGHKLNEPLPLQAELQSRPDIRKTMENDLYQGYMDDARLIVWTFTKSGHDAYPAVVCRELRQENGAINVHMQVGCNGTKANCDALVESFKLLNEQMRQNVQQRLQRP